MSRSLLSVCFPVCLLVWCCTTYVQQKHVVQHRSQWMRQLWANTASEVERQPFTYYYYSSLTCIVSLYSVLIIRLSKFNNHPDWLKTLTTDNSEWMRQSRGKGTHRYRSPILATSLLMAVWRKVWVCSAACRAPLFAFGLPPTTIQKHITPALDYLKCQSPGSLGQTLNGPKCVDTKVLG